MNKASLRKIFLSQISSLSKQRREQGSKDACDTLKDLSKEASWVASFAPIDSEIDIWDFNKEMILEKKLLLPQVVGSKLHYYPVHSIKDLKPSKWGVLEPQNSQEPPIQISLVSFFIIPALAYDGEGGRLGRGKGFYDSFISLYNPIKTLGIGFKEQISSTSLPLEAHDQKVNEVLLF